MLTSKISTSIIIPMPETAPRATEMTSSVQLPENVQTAALENLKDLHDRAEKTSTTIQEIINKGTPTHEQIMTAVEGAKKQDKWQVGRDIVRGAMIELGYTAGKDRKDLDLTDVDMLAPGTTPNFEANRQKGKPQVFFTQIFEEVHEEEGSWLSKLFKRKSSDRDFSIDGNTSEAEPKKRRTDEVLVVVNMNNGDKPENNTVTVVLAKQKAGRLDIDGGAVVCTMSEADYLKKAKKPQNAEERMIAGSYTMKGYGESFKRETGQTPEQYWDSWDNDRDNDPNFWKSEKYKGELMDRLSGAYVEALKRTKQMTDEIVKETERRLEEQKQLREKYAKDPVFVGLINNVLREAVARKDPRVEDLFTHLETLFPGSTTIPEIAQLRNEGGKR